MGVNLAGALVLLIAVSYIKAQEYVILGETDLDTWDVDQNQNFFDQPNHVIHRRDVADTDLEGSGNGEPDQAVEPPQESTNNNTSSNEENEEPPAVDQPALIQEGNVTYQISNFEELNPATNAEEAPKSNEANVEPEVPSADSVQEENKTDAPSSVQKTEVDGVIGDNQPESVEPAEPDQQGVAPIAQVFENVADEIAATTQKPDVVNKDESEQIAVKIANPTESPDVANEGVEKIAVGVVNATEETDVAPKENPDLPPLVHQIISDETASGVAQSTVVPLTKTDSPIVPEKEGVSADTENKDKEGLKVTPQALPSNLAEDDATKNKESEQVNAQQSGNAVMFKVPNSGGASQVEGSESDKALQGMAENAKISNEPTEPATGESAKNVTKAGKDTTILVVLFVVVIAIGGAAFTHNYIKKRKQNAATNEDIVNGIRRSLQNLTSSNGKNTTDVEQGTEMKPLMKENSPTLTKVYTDSKKEVPA